VYSVKDLWDCYKTDETVLRNYNGKLQYQENPSNKSTFLVVEGIKTRNARGADAFTPLISTRRQDGPTTLYRTEHQWIASNRLTMTLQYAHIHEDWGQFFQNDSLFNVQPISFIDTGFVDRNATGGNYHTIRPQDDIKGDGNFFVSNVLGGDHSIKFGFDVRRSPVESINTYGGGATIRIRSTANQGNCTVGGVTALCNEVDVRRDSDLTYIQYNRSLYFNDSFKKGSATVNFGLRYDYQKDFGRSGTVPANVIIPDLLPAIAAGPEVDSGARYNNLSPRGGITYDLTGNGKTVLKANGGRYWGLGIYTASTLEVTTATTLRYAWRDLNGDTTAQRNEIDFVRGFLTTPSSNYDPANPNSATVPATVDRNLKNDITDEFIASLDHELMPNFGVGVSYIYRNYHQFQDTYRSDPRDTTASYSQAITLTVPCGNTVNGALTCPQSSYTGTYYQRPTATGALHSPTILRNNTQYNTYSGIELTARKRLAHKWMMNSSLSWNRQLHFEPNADTDYLDPTNHLPVELISGFESGTRNGAWIGKISGMYQFPWGINGAANFNGHSSFPMNPYIITPNRSSSLGTVNVRLQGTNTLRYDPLYQLDLHVDKTLSFGGQRRVSLNYDLFNVFNNNVVFSVEERQNRSTANNILTLLAPRVMRFGVKVNF